VEAGRVDIGRTASYNIKCEFDFGKTGHEIGNFGSIGNDEKGLLEINGRDGDNGIDSF
jgi:hypothetical protein